jgi:hypothetical protein
VQSSVGGGLRKLRGLARKISPLRHICIGLPFLMGGCVADLFGDRAASYNQEAATNKDQTILTNIVRASLGRPLQFTDLTTVSGTASQSLSLAGVFPFAMHRPSTVGISSTFSPTVTLSGGPTFSVANLSTKEFYSGILTPTELPILSYYLEQGDYIPSLLFSLIISNIIIRGPEDRRIPNNVENFDVFYRSLNGLLAMGLTAERISKPIAEGPPLIPEEAKEPKLLGSLASGAAAGNTTLDLKPYDVPSDLAKKEDPNLLPAEYKRLKDHNQTIYYRLEKKSPSPNSRFCLDRAEVEKNLPGGRLPERFSLRHPITIRRGDVIYVDINERNLCGASARVGAGVSLKVSENVEFQTRSVKEIINYLGDIVRQGVPIMIGITPESKPTTELFRASEQPPQGRNISATVDGYTYYIDVSATDKDMSSRVIEILAELIALHNSAKDLPAPNVITVISP